MVGAITFSVLIDNRKNYRVIKSLFNDGIAYVLGTVIILLANLDKIPTAITLIFTNAFSGEAAAGGSIGVVIQRGIARGVFSNESGLGTAPIAQAAAKPGDPVLQGSVAMIGTFIDTIVICSMTAMVILISGIYSETDYVSGSQNVSLTINAFGNALPGFEWIVVFGTVLFTMTTILGWGYYSECASSLWLASAIKPFRLVCRLQLER